MTPAELIALHAGMISLFPWNVNIVLANQIRKLWIDDNSTLLKGIFISAITASSLSCNWLTSFLVIPIQKLFINARYAKRILVTLLTLFIISYMVFTLPLLMASLKPKYYKNDLISGPIIFSIVVIFAGIAAIGQSIFEAVILTRLTLIKTESTKLLINYYSGINVSGIFVVICQIIFMGGEIIFTSCGNCIEAYHHEFSAGFLLGAIVIVTVPLFYSGRMLIEMANYGHYSIPEQNVNSTLTSENESTRNQYWTIFLSLKWLWLSSLLNLCTLLFYFPALCFTRPSMQAIIVSPISKFLGSLKVPITIFLNFGIFALLGNYVGGYVSQRVPLPKRYWYILPGQIIYCTTVALGFAANYIYPGHVPEAVTIGALSLTAFIYGFTHMSLITFANRHYKVFNNPSKSAIAARIIAASIPTGLVLGSLCSFIITYIIN